MRVGLYAHVSTHDQQTLPMQRDAIAMREYAAARGWTVVVQIEEVTSGASHRPERERLLKAARRREVDALLVWRLDRWGRSLPDLFGTLQELTALGVGFVSLTEAMDLTTPMGRAMAAMLSVFAEFEREVLRQRVKAGIASARSKGWPHGRPQTAQKRTPLVLALYQQGVSQTQIARQLQIGPASVHRALDAHGLLPKTTCHPSHPSENRKRLLYECLISPFRSVGRH